MKTEQLNFISMTFTLCLTMQLALGDCAVVPVQGQDTKSTASPELVAEEALDRIGDQILEIAKGYKAYGRVDDEMRWSPAMCRMPNPSMARFSRSQDSETHGQKLYYVFAKKQSTYLNFKTEDQPIGQAIVKQAWHPETHGGKAVPDVFKDIKRDDPSKELNGEKLLMLSGGYFPYAKRDGKWFHAKQKAGLFVMLKVGTSSDSETSEAVKTDAGWVYATTNDDGTEVTSLGMLQSCIKCHRTATRDRMFGLAPTKN